MYDRSVTLKFLLNFTVDSRILSLLENRTKTIGSYNYQSTVLFNSYMICIKI